MSEEFTKDTDLQFPSATIVTASAGAGKTYALTHRYVQLLLSNKIQHNSLQNILAITFTNNAAAEMKQRILKLLKLASLGDEKTLQQLRGIVPAKDVELRSRATHLIDEILDNYSDFQVRTIDSFMSTVFKSSSLEYGYHPDFEISLLADRLFDAALELFSREIKENSPQAGLIGNLLDLIAENRKGDGTFPWNPYRDLSAHIKKIYNAITAQTKPLNTNKSPLRSSSLNSEITAQTEKVAALITRSGLTAGSNFSADVALVRAGDLQAILGRKLRPSPVNKPKGKIETAAYEKWIQSIEDEHGKLNELLRRYILSHAESYYQPYIEAYGLIQGSLETLKRQEGTIFIDDLNKTLAANLNSEVVPEIYFKLGETIYHYLIDEFQDTSQIQWVNLFPLIEESLSKGGSLFVVGDTKQSIYGFRNADWRIMKRLADANPFPSARHEVKALDINYRSYERIVDFSREVFHTIIPGEGFGRETAASGLSSFEQRVTKEHAGRGYVEVSLMEEQAESRVEKPKLLAIVAECHSRGYRFNEIAILTAENRDVTEISGWLNEQGIPIVSHSTLDLRRRKSAGEFVALLRFLDSPVDDLSFATFLLGDIFSNYLAKETLGPTRDELAEVILAARTRSSGPLYTVFRDRFTDIWETHFEHLFNVVGYFPLYDLVSEAYKIFHVFETSPGEESALAKLLEVIKIFEHEGTNTIKHFLEYSADDTNDEPWKIEVPSDIDALQVMTIHKAKGMEFPVAIVLLRDTTARGAGYLLREDEHSVQLLRVTKKMGENVEELQALLEEETFRQKVDSFNKLYVAFTRAEKEMYVLGVYSKVRKEPTRFLPAAKSEPSQKPELSFVSIQKEHRIELLHHNVRKPLSVQKYESIGGPEAKRGDVIHRILSTIEFISDEFVARLESLTDRVCAEMAYRGSGGEVQSTIRRFISDEKFRILFVADGGRTILREQDLTNGAGALYRADRIIIDKSKTTVVDFKTGGDENEDEYEDQVRNYLGMMREVYPDKKIVGIIAYIDLMKSKDVS